MLFVIAWRNIWRNKVRSFVVILSIAVGLWAGIFTASFMYGISNQRLNNIINTQISHIQIHQKGFTDDMESNLTVRNGQQIVDQLKHNEFILVGDIKLIVESSDKKRIKMVKAVQSNEI